MVAMIVAVLDVSALAILTLRQVMAGQEGVEPPETAQSGRLLPGHGPDLVVGADMGQIED